MGCRNIKTLLSANQDDIWKDTSIVISHDLILENDHHIATIQKTNRNKKRQSNPNMKPGDIICLDIIKNTSTLSVTQSTMYPFFLLAVNAFSRMPKLQELQGFSASEIIDALKFILVQLYNLEFNTVIHITERIQADFGTAFTSKAF